VRGTVKLPTGKSDIGVSTGKADAMLDFIVSREIATSVELSGFAGYEFRGSPEGFQIPTRAVNWGVGAAFPSRAVRLADRDVVIARGDVGVSNAHTGTYQNIVSFPFGASVLLRPSLTDPRDQRGGRCCHPACPRERPCGRAWTCRDW